MQEVTGAAGMIDRSVEAVREEVINIAERSAAMNAYSMEMKQQAEALESDARGSMSETEKRIGEIMAALNKAIEDSQSVDQSDQSVGTECIHRSGQGRRCGQRICRGSG